MDGGLRLTLEIVPPYISDRGLSYVLPKARWDRIRRGVAEAHGHRCAACSVTSRRSGPLQCHEVWEYDLGTLRGPTPDETAARNVEGKTLWSWSGAKARESVRRGVRRLVGLMPLCGPCHRAKHSDRSCFLLSEVRRDLAALGRDSEPSLVLREALAYERDQFPNRSFAHFVEVNQGVPPVILEAHCLEVCALRASRRDVEWASDYDGFDRLGESG